MNISDNVVDIVIDQKQLEYQISNVAYIVSQTAETNAHVIADITADGNIDRVRDMEESAFYEVVERLHPFTKSALPDATVLDYERDEDTRTYTIHLKTQDMSLSTAKLLRTQVVEYIVTKVLADYLSMVAPVLSETWYAKNAVVEKAIHECLIHTVKPIRIKKSPF